jgi:quercetin dioxygenase-like cupin family protein
MRNTCAIGAVLLVSCAAAAPGPAVVKPADVESRWSPSGEVRVDILARGENAFVARLTIDPGASLPEHRDPTEEYIHVIEGTGSLVIDGWRYDVGPGDTVFMPADATVSYENGGESMVAIQVFAGPESAEKYDSWPRTRPE